MLSISLGYISIKYENFSALGVRLDDGDFKTIVEYPKYLALKHETVQKSDHLVYLNPSGVAYLRDVWGKNVNKCGEKRNSKETVKESEKHFKRRRSAIRQSNYEFDCWFLLSTRKVSAVLLNLHKLIYILQYLGQNLNQKERLNTTLKKPVSLDTEVTGDTSDSWKMIWQKKMVLSLKD